MICHTCGLEIGDNRHTYLSISGETVHYLNVQCIDALKQENAALRAKAELGEALLSVCERAEKFIDAILSFYGQNLEAVGWHLNGAPEPFDNFIDENSDGSELDDLRAAVQSAKAAIEKGGE